MRGNPHLFLCSGRGTSPTQFGWSSRGLRPRMYGGFAPACRYLHIRIDPNHQVVSCRNHSKEFFNPIPSCFLLFPVQHFIVIPAVRFHSKIDPLPSLMFCPFIQPYCSSIVISSLSLPLTVTVFSVNSMVRKPR